MSPHVMLLGCIVTDVVVSPCSPQSTPTYMVDHSFISITVDQDISTNDTIVVFVDGPQPRHGGQRGNQRGG